MKSVLRSFLFSLSALVILVPAYAVVEVVFIKPGSYTDASVRNGQFNSTNLGIISAVRGHLMNLGDKYLSPREGPQTEVLDIDLAGRYEWWRFPFDARIMRDITSPAMEVRYIYYVNGIKVDESEERITDMNYLLSAGKGGSSDSLKYEKKMLDPWFRERFVNHESASQ